MRSFIASLRSRFRLRWLTAAIFLLVAGLTAALVVSRWEEIRGFPWRLHWGYLALAAVFHWLALGVTFIVWHLMVRRLGGFDHLGTNFYIYYVSTLAKRVPTSVPYIGGRLVMYGQVGVAASAVLNCTLLENLLIGVGGIFTFLVFLPLYADVPAFSLPLAGLGIGLIALLLVRPQLFVEATNRLLRRFGRRELDRVPARADVLLWTGLYVLPWLLAGLSLYFVPRAFTRVPGPGVVDAIRISTLTMLVALLSVIMPGGLGLKEITAGALLAPWMPFSTAVLLSLGYRLLQTVDDLLWAGAAALWVGAFRRELPDGTVGLTGAGVENPVGKAE